MDIAQIDVDPVNPTPDAAAGDADQGYQFMMAFEVTSASPYLWVRFFQEPDANGFHSITAEDARTLGRALCALAGALEEDASSLGNAFPKPSRARE